jgi:hypothetical protein
MLSTTIDNVGSNSTPSLATPKFGSQGVPSVLCGLGRATKQRRGRDDCVWMRNGGEITSLFQCFGFAGTVSGLAKGVTNHGTQHTRQEKHN